MDVLVVGLNYHSAPVEVRERVALPAGQLPEVAQSVCEQLSQGIVLSTCNRTEIYTVADHPRAQRQKVVDFITGYSGLEASELSPYLYRFQSVEAVTHLFRVAAGLDSMILGEFEVLGQVRRALGEAENTGLVRLPLLNLFRQAVRVGRRARSETDISKNALSVSAAGVELARKHFPELRRSQALVISAGEAGRLTAQALAKVGVGHMVVTSRSFERAQDLASELGAEAVAFHHMEDSLQVSDIVICCSGAPHFILEPRAVSEAMQSRPQRPLVLIDLAVPRDVDPAAREIEGVSLYDIDDLNAVSESNRRRREREARKVMGIIEAEVHDFRAWWETLAVRSTITALVEKAECIRAAQLAKALHRLKGLSPEQQASLDAMTRAIVKGILHYPIACLRNGHQGTEYAQAVQEIFSLKAMSSIPGDEAHREMQ